MDERQPTSSNTGHESSRSTGSPASSGSSGSSTSSALRERRGPLSPQEEVDRLMSIYGESQPMRTMELLERQFNILHNRAQVLLGLCGVVVTTTGFSGRLIAGTSVGAQVAVIIGVVLSLLAAVVVVLKVLPLSWLTQRPGEMTRPWLEDCIAYRDRKTRSYRLAVYILLAGLAIYVVAVGLMLVDPYGFAPPEGR